MPSSATYLFDANAIIEAVRTGTWAAISGGLTVETVRECAHECLRGDHVATGYVVVGQSELDRLSAIHVPTDDQIATVLAMPRSAALHDGERDLLAHALSRAPPPMWLVCSPDRASVRFAVEAAVGDCLVSLEEIVTAVGGRPTLRLADHFTKKWLSARRAEAILGIL